MRPSALLISIALLAAVTACGASAGNGTITVGTLYSGSGSFAASSGPEFTGLKFWISQVNAAGGVFVRAAGCKEKVELVAYDDQSSPTIASTLYDRLITQARVDILVSDFGSVLTAPALTIAEERRQLLFDPTGSAMSLFSPSNPYVVLTSVPTSAVWPTPLANFVISRKISRIAIIHDGNDFDESQDQTVAAQLTRDGAAPVLNTSVPATTSDYAALIQSVRRMRPQAVLEFGYENNDVDFLNDLHSVAGRFPMVFTVFPGQLTQLLEQQVGTAGLAYTFTYGFPPEVAYSNVTIGMTTRQFVRKFQAANHTAVNFLNIAGYTAGLAIQAALEHATTLSQLGLRFALSQVSGALNTIEGMFKIDSTGAQIGEMLPIAQMMPRGGGTTVEVVYPPGEARVAAKYPAPRG